jgi:photosystem II stability/assembly factor-like uncharacterized protein
MRGRSPLWIGLAVAAALAAVPGGAPADGPPGGDPPSAAGPRVGGWRAAPIFGADVRSVVLHPADPDTLLAGTSAGHVYLSRDGGATWRDAGDGVALPGWVVSDLVFDPAAPPAGGEAAGPPRLWAALWGVWGGGTVVASDDLGRTWLPSGDGLPGDQVYTLAIAPAGFTALGRSPADLPALDEPSRSVPLDAPPGEGPALDRPPAAGAGAGPRLYAGTRRGVYRSDDGGAAWRGLTAALPEVEKVTSLLVDPAAPDSVIAGTWRRAYRSDDGGAAWRGIFTGMALDSEVFSLQPVPGRPGEIWASTCGWVYHTEDGGAGWTRYQEGLDSRRTPSFAVLPSGRLLAGTTAGLYVSDDGGAGWTLRTDPGLAVLDIAVEGERVVLGTEGSGVWISGDGAETFRPAALGMTNLRVGALARAGRELLAAVNHAGPASGVYGSADGGASFGRPEPLPTVLALTVAGYRVFAATERGLFERSGDAWRQVAELGERRVEQVAAEGERVVARAADGLWELAGDRFVPAPYRHGRPRSAALFDQALWVSAADGLYRLTAAENDAVPAPLAGGRLDRLASTAGDRLLLSGSGGVWMRTGSAAPWVAIAAGEAAVRPTGDPRYPALVLGAAGAFLVEAEGGALRGAPAAGLLHPVALPVPARDVTAAALFDGKLVLGTSGYGLWVGDVTAAPSPAAPATTSAAGGSPPAAGDSAAAAGATAAGPKSSR